MLRTLAIAATFALVATSSFAAKGDGGGPPYTLDAKGKCHGAKAFASADMCKTATPAATVAAGSPKKCVKGKACGNTCISVKDVCHK
jgi:hypothetical protein